MKLNTCKELQSCKMTMQWLMDHKYTLPDLDGPKFMHAHTGTLEIKMASAPPYTGSATVEILSNGQNTTKVINKTTRASVKRIVVGNARRSSLT